MKKLLALILAVALAMPALALADAADYVGTWICVTGIPSYEIFILTEDGRALYGNASFGTENPFTRAFAGTWEETGRGIHIVYGNTAEGDFYLNASGDLVSDLGITYTCIGNGASAAVPEGAIVLPQGVYQVGPDVPPGRYKISVDPEITYATVEIYRDEKDTYGKTYFLGTVYKSSEMNITLKEGMSIEMASCAVTLTPVE